MSPNAGDYQLGMFYLYEGVCLVQSNTGLECAQLHAGSTFGELEAVLGVAHGARVKTLTYCTLYCILRPVLRRIMEVCSASVFKMK